MSQKILVHLRRGSLRWRDLHALTQPKHDPELAAHLHRLAIAGLIIRTMVSPGPPAKVMYTLSPSGVEKARMWIVPAERMKARKEHRVPLFDAALAIIDAAPKGDYLFPGPRGKPLSQMAVRLLFQRLGISGQITRHGFRSSFRDWAAETTHYPNEVLEMALAHAVANKVEAAYRRGDMLAKRQQLMADWQRFCDGK